ncbi:MAG: hypothetical protein IJ240_00980 [Clostridia bacterium]|nr:hypothetical protein [Clostridia bacterium]
MTKRLLLPAALLLFWLCLLPNLAAGAEDMPLLSKEEKLFIGKAGDYQLIYVARMETALPGMHNVKHQLALLDSAGHTLATFSSGRDVSVSESKGYWEYGVPFTLTYRVKQLDPDVRERVADYRLEFTEVTEREYGSLDRLEWPVKQVSVEPGGYIRGTFVNPLDYAVIPKNIGGFEAQCWVYNGNDELVFFTNSSMMNYDVIASYSAHSEHQFEFRLPTGLEKLIGDDLRAKVVITMRKPDDYVSTVPEPDNDLPVKVSDENLYVYARETYDIYQCDYSALITNEGSETVQVLSSAKLMGSGRAELARFSLNSVVLFPGQTASIQGTGNIERVRYAQLEDYQVHLTVRPATGYRGYTTIKATDVGVYRGENGGVSGVYGTVTNPLDHQIKDPIMTVRVYDKTGRLVYTQHSNRTGNANIDVNRRMPAKEPMNVHASWFADLGTLMQQDAPVDRAEIELVWYDKE